MKHGPRTGQPCSYTAGRGTGHVGHGKCRKHRGNDGPIKHGLHSKFRNLDGSSIYSLPHMDEAKHGTMEDDIVAMRALALRCQTEFLTALNMKATTDEEKMDRRQRIERYTSGLASLIDRANGLEVRLRKLQQTDEFLVSIDRVRDWFRQLVEALLAAGIDPEIIQRMRKVSEDMRMSGGDDS